MIQPAKYNGINFSPDFIRFGGNYDYNAQRVKNLLPRDKEIKYLSFFIATETEPTNVKLDVFGTSFLEINPISLLAANGGYIYFFTIAANTLPIGDLYFKVIVDSEFIFSEIYDCQLSDSEIVHLVASNADNRHGYLSNQTFGFFKSAKFKTDFFLNEKVEYNYSYSRKKILSSENQIGKRFSFFDLTIYQQNLLKWLCNCENLTIDGVQYQLISDFTEINNDPNSEIMILQADFVEVNQSFFANGSTDTPLNIFTNSFFN